jgi:hypothetical protein
MCLRGGVMQTFWAFGFAGGYWLLMAELFPLATRPLAASLLTGCVMLTYGVTSLMAMPMVCTVQLGLLLFYAGGSLLMLVRCRKAVQHQMHRQLHIMFLKPENSSEA